VSRDAAQRLARLARVERALARLAAADRAAADAAHAASIADGEAIVASLSGDSPLHGLIVATMAGALRRNGEATAARAAEAEAATARHRRAEQRARIVAERAGEAATAAEREAERRRLEAIGTTAAGVAPMRQGKPPDRLDP
jgi:hypothetical protein